MMAVAWEAETVVALEVAGWVAEHGAALWMLSDPTAFDHGRHPKALPCRA